MLTLVLIGTALAVLAGLVIKFALPHITPGRDTSLTLTEMVVGTLLCALVVMPAVAGIGISIARAHGATFNEYWSGSEKAAVMDTTTCQRDGSCRRTYDCDSYIVMVTKTRQVPYTATEFYTTSDGRSSTRTVTRYRTETYIEPETRWHSCPYVTHEYTYKVTDTLGDTHTMGSHWFPENPAAHRWTGYGHTAARWGFGAPGLPSGVESGIPTLWAQAKARIDAGTPGGVTKVMGYKNYILASSKDIYEKSSGAIASYKKDGLLPTPVTGTYDFYKANKVYFVGKTPGDAADWQETAMRFNGHFGSERQGDLHLIVVNDARVTDPDTYANAVLAYWQSPELGKNALSKNGYVVIVGSTDGTTVAWARGLSGMPMGNERLTVDVREDLTGSALTPSALFGTPPGQSIDGALGALIFDTDNGFKRVEMKDYDYLYEQIQPTGDQKVFIVIVGFLLALAVWALFVLVDLRIPTAVRALFPSRSGKGGSYNAAPDNLTASDLAPESGLATGSDSYMDAWEKRARLLHDRQRDIESPHH